MTSDQRMDHDEVRRRSAEALKKIFEQVYDQPTEQQKLFLEHLGAKPQNGLFTVGNSGSTAWMWVKGEAIDLRLIKTTEPERGKEFASQLLNQICKYADETTVTLLLKVESKDLNGLSEADLLAWYRRRGFVGDANGMVREPQ